MSTEYTLEPVDLYEVIEAPPKSGSPLLAELSTRESLPVFVTEEYLSDFFLSTTDDQECIGFSRADRESWQDAVTNFSAQYIESLDDDCLQASRASRLYHVCQEFSHFKCLHSHQAIKNNLMHYLERPDEYEGRRSVIKSIFELLMYLPEFPGEIENVRLDDEDRIEFSLKGDRRLMNVTVKGGGEFIYSMVFRGNSLSNISGKVTVRDSRDSRTVRRIFRAFYG